MCVYQLNPWAVIFYLVCWRIPAKTGGCRLHSGLYLSICQTSNQHRKIKSKSDLNRQFTILNVSIFLLNVHPLKLEEIDVSSTQQDISKYVLLVAKLNEVALVLSFSTQTWICLRTFSTWTHSPLRETGGWEVWRYEKLKTPRQRSSQPSQALSLI